MKKMHLTVLLLSSYAATSAMHRSYELPHEEVIKDRLRYKINKQFGPDYGTNIGYNFSATTGLAKLAHQQHCPLSVVAYVHGDVSRFCGEYMNTENAPRKPLEHIVLREMLKDHPQAIEALENNYGFLPRKIK